MKLELYYYPSCPFCVRVLNVIEDLKLGAKIKLKDIHKDSQYAQFHLEKTGRHTVPCLYIDDTPMFESSDIINWMHKNQSII